jgi:DNA-directed RNA polymerase sigma subunit (sigma70/sigma32)
MAIAQSRLIEGATLSDIGAEYGLSKERVSQIEKRVIRKFMAILKIAA